MERSIAEGQFWNRRPDWLAAIAGPAPAADLPPVADGHAPAGVGDVAAPATSRGADRGWTRAIGLVIAGLILLIFLVCNPNRHNFYEHFTWQAAAWLEGQAGIRYPVCSSDGTPTFPGDTCLWIADADAPYNDFFLDVLPVTDANGQPTGRALIPFPPLPAVVLLPFVAVFGLATDAQTLAALIGGLDVWLAWWMLGRLGLPVTVRAATTVFFGLGTVFWYTSMLGTTWYLAHVVAVALTILAIGIALAGDRAAVGEARSTVIEGDGGGQADATARVEGHGRIEDATDTGLTFESIRQELVVALRGDPFGLIDRRQFLAGLALGLACTARLTIVFGLPFLFFVGPGRTPLQRVISAGLGAALPILVLVAYNVATTGHLFHPGYDYLYQQEAYGYPELGYNPDWSIEDPRYLPQNLALMLAGPPDVMPPCPPDTIRSLFSDVCPIIVPRQVGMSLLLTSPGYLLAIPALIRLRRSRLLAGAALTIGAIAFVNLMHFSQGWVQFGYRFSNDFAPFALLLVALGILRLGQVRGWAAGLIGVSIAVNAWGVAWGLILGW